MTTLPAETITAVCKNISKSNRYLLDLEALNEMRMEKVFCDVVIQCKDSTFYAHKCVLAAISPYFKTLFLSPYIVSTDNLQIANFDDFSVETVDLLLTIIYDQIDVESANLQELLKLAEFLQYDWLVNLLVENIRKVINETNCLSWCLIAQECGVEDLSILAESYMRINYHKLKEMECYQSDIELIRELVVKKENGFQKELVFYHTNDEGNIYMIDVLTGGCDKYTGGPCGYEMHPETDTGGNQNYDKFYIVSFFVYRKQLFLVSYYTHFPDDFRNDYDVFTDYEVTVDVQLYNQCAERYHKLLRFNQGNLISEVNGNSIRSNKFVLTQVFFDDLRHFYMLFDYKCKNVLIYKVDLIKGPSSGYVKLDFTIPQKFCFVESKHLGTLLVLGLQHIYNLEEHDFTGNGNNTIKKLVIEVDWQSINNSNSGNVSKAMKAVQWNVLSFNGELYCFVVFLQDKTRLNVLKLNIENLCWMHFCDFPLLDNDLTNAFCCQGKMFVVLSSVEYENYCDRDLSCILKSFRRGCEGRHHEEDDVYDSVFHFDADRKHLKDMEIRLPPSHKSTYNACIVPSHLMV